MNQRGPEKQSQKGLNLAINYFLQYQEQKDAQNNNCRNPDFFYLFIHVHNGEVGKTCWESAGADSKRQAISSQTEQHGIARPGLLRA